MNLLPLPIDIFLMIAIPVSTYISEIIYLFKFSCIIYSQKHINIPFHMKYYHILELSIAYSISIRF